MKTKNVFAPSLLVLLTALMLSSCASAPPAKQPIFTPTTFNGKPHMIVANAPESRSKGDLIVYRALGEIRAATIVNVRGPGVFRVEDGTLVTPSNYVGSLVPVELAK
jgi:hypothetical protein